MARIATLAAASIALSGAPCLAQATRTPTLQDVPFGQLSSIASDLTNRQNTCSFTSTLPVTYSVTATGNGSGSAFTLTNGTSLIPYEVQWAQTANATSGSNLVAGQALTNQQSAALLSGLTCLLGFTNATVIVIVRATSLQQATAGGYTGSLSILLTAQ